MLHESTFFNAMTLLPPHEGSIEIYTASLDASDPGSDDLRHASLSSNAPFGAQPVDFGFPNVRDGNDLLECNSAFTPSFTYEFVSFSIRWAQQLLTRHIEEDPCRSTYLPPAFLAGQIKVSAHGLTPTPNATPSANSTLAGFGPLAC
jgi:hypothetical protein